MMVFKVPSLRNIQKTGPYFHDGSVATLDEAVRDMGVHQRGVELTPAQVKSIETWMNALTGPIPTAYIQPPELPKARHRRLRQPASSSAPATSKPESKARAFAWMMIARTSATLALSGSLSNSVVYSSELKRRMCHSRTLGSKSCNLIPGPQGR